VVSGTEAGERIAGSRHVDVLKGFGGSDTLLGLGGRDKLYGHAGNDILNGGTGGDVLTGGAGRDAFVFSARPDAHAPDIIRDFSVRDDTIRLHVKAFTSLHQTGRLPADTFYKGVAAHEADDRIVYDETSGALLYDADGTGAGAAIQFAQLRHHPAITAADVLVV
jgi:Ca2+-binding RTX toxin-like protein